MKKIKVKELKSLAENKLGQHLTEFLILFLAVAVGFVGTQLYLRRGVNAKLKHVELQLNKSVGASGSSGNQAADPCHRVWVRLLNNLGSQVWRCSFTVHETTLAKWNTWRSELLQCCGTYSTLDPNNSTCALNNSAPFVQNGCALCMNLAYGQTYYFKWNETGSDSNSDPQINLQRCCTACSGAATPLPCQNGTVCQ